MSVGTFSASLQHVCTRSRHATVLMHHQCLGFSFCGQMQGICPWKENAKNKDIYFLAFPFHGSAPLVLPAVICNKVWCIRTGGRLCCKEAEKCQLTASFAKGSVMLLQWKETSDFLLGVILQDNRQYNIAALFPMVK